MRSARNIGGIIEARLSPHALDALRRVAAAAESVGAAPYLVGGFARDALMGVGGAVDIDITLAGVDSAAFERVAERAGGSLTNRSRFGTAKLQVGDARMDIAMARAESYPTPGSLPAVRAGDIRQDMDRRDFTVNAMAVSLAADGWGDLYDPRGGRRDLGARLLRALHAHSFRDDATRILRAARYCARLGLTPTEDTREALIASTSHISAISAARVRNELERVFDERDAAPEAMRLLSEWEALSAIHPALGYSPAAWRDFVAETADAPAKSRNGIAYAMLCRGVSDADASGVVARLMPDGAGARRIREAGALGRDLDRLGERALASLPNSRLAALLDPLDEDSVRGVALASRGAARRRLVEYLALHRGARSELGGAELIAMGAPRGRAVGCILRRLRDARLDGEASSIADERALAERLIKG